MVPNWFPLARVCFDFSSLMAVVEGSDCPLTNDALTVWSMFWNWSDLLGRQPGSNSPSLLIAGKHSPAVECCRVRSATTKEPWRISSSGWRRSEWSGVGIFHRELQDQPERKHFSVAPLHFYTCDGDQIQSPSFQLTAGLKINQTAPPVISALFCAFQTSRLTWAPENYSPRWLRVDSSRLLCCFLPSKHSPHFFLIPCGPHPSTGVEVSLNRVSIVPKTPSNYLLYYKSVQIKVCGWQTSLLFLPPPQPPTIQPSLPSGQRNVEKKTCSVFRVKRSWVAASCCSTMQSSKVNVSLWERERRRERVRESWKKWVC